MSKSGLLDFLAKQAVALPEEIVEVPEWGRAVMLRGFTSRERDSFEEDQLRRSNAKAANGAKVGATVADLTNFRARLVARHLVEGGMRTFANPRGEDVLGEQPAAVIDRLFAVAQKLSGFSAQDVEELSKNSAATGADASSSASLLPSDAPSLN
jgi:hypothetical protein